MSYIDNSLVMSDAQAVTASADSTNSIDTQSALRNIGNGRPIELIIVVATTVAASGGASNTTFSLQDSADNSSFATVVQGPAIAKATLVQGYVALRIMLPHGLRRYINVHYAVDTNNLTAGAFTAYLALDRQDNVAGTPGFTIP